MEEKMEVKKKTYDFLVYSYFGIVSKEMNKNDEVKYVQFKCAWRAYLDLNRTLKFKEDDLPDEKKIQFRNNVCKIIVDNLKELSEKRDKNSFDGKHKDICKEIIEAVAEYVDLSYGQAQKWLNMTLKYLWLLNYWAGDETLLHVPVDSFIMEAASEKLNVDIPRKKGEPKKYSTSASEPWSQWEEGEYTDFQKALKDKCSQAPIRWENDAWIEIAEHRRLKEEKKKAEKKKA